MRIRGYQCTTGDGEKYVYAVARDEAGNETTVEVPSTFTLDTQLPTVSVYDVDFNRISTVNAPRLQLTSEGAITALDKRTDECWFKFKPDSKIQAYKVCAYWDAEQAEAVIDVDAEEPIYADTEFVGNPDSSFNMSATGLNQNSEVTCRINGGDYYQALRSAY